MHRINLKYIVLTLYTLLIVCMGLTTVIEKIEGRDYVAEHIYGSWWFVAMWGMLAMASMVFLLRKRMHKKLAVFMLHVSFAVMLIGALVTHLTSEGGTVHLRTGENISHFINDDGNVCLFPFVMNLKDFEIQTYPGTDAVMDYRCNIEVTHDGKTEQISVSMNNIGKADGYRFYQSAYDSDGMGTQLLVGHDPYGIAITYAGYVMLLVSLLWTMLSKHTRIRQLYRLATRPVIMLAIFGLCNMANAQGLPDQEGKKDRANEVQITPVSEEIAHAFGRLAVLYNGRICPINTVANEFVTKLCGKSRWNGYSADEIFVSWMIYYTEWEQQKLIRVKSDEVQRMIGIDGKWASVRDFYTANNEYKLSGKANDLHLPAATRKAIRETDEKIQVVTMFYNNEMLRIFPLKSVQTDGGRMLTWHAPGSTELPLDTPTEEFQFINHAMDYLVESTLVNDAEGARMMISKIRLYQREKAGDVLPSAAMIGVEVFYNTLQSARWVVFLCLTLSLIFCMVWLSGKSGRIINAMHLSYICAQTLFLSVLLVLRWMVSGHIPMSNGYETMLFMSWVTLVISLIAMRKIPVMKAFGPLVSSFCMLVSMLAVGSPQITHLMPVLQSPLLSMHVALIMISYALLAIITLVAMRGLMLARKKEEGELTRMTALSQLLLYPAIATLTIGIFIGAVWANVSWGTYWSWDPKETWALITLMIYAIPLHRSFMSVSPAKYHLYILLSFLAVLMTYFGVNYFLSGMHSYA